MRELLINKIVNDITIKTQIINALLEKKTKEKNVKKINKLLKKIVILEMMLQKINNNDNK